MHLIDLIEEKQTDILNIWLDLIINTYPKDAQGFLRNQENPFSNPVGNTFKQDTAVLIQALLTEVDPEILSNSLDNIIRIRSVQEFTPSKAVSFIFLLKKAVIDELRDELLEYRLFGELQEIESKIDNLILLAFDSYQKCREALYLARSKELSRRTNIILSRFNYAVPENELDVSAE
ncbi:RsbRD N-terminal domain-containing protein [bacterium]|nr:RsbRD N-terminal domain-containing protein [bacterium]